MQQYPLLFCTILAALLCSPVCIAQTTDAVQEVRFSFALIGDIPYSQSQVGAVERLIWDINRDASVRFVMHAGDIKSGIEHCDDALLRARFDLFQQFRRAFIFTPGDNDWTDCHRGSNGAYHPLERLRFLRALFYPESDLTTGQSPIRVSRQSSMPGFGEYVENALFTHGRVVFSTIHIVGSNNNLEPWKGIDRSDSTISPRADRMAEFESRLAADLHWLDHTFRRAESAGANGVFILIHANPRFETSAARPARAGFNRFIDRIRQHVQAYSRPIVLAHGDDHHFLIDKPFDQGSQGVRAFKFLRVQTFGSPHVNWIKVTVDPASADIFAFEPRFVSDMLGAIQ